MITTHKHRDHLQLQLQSANEGKGISIFGFLLPRNGMPVCLPANPIKREDGLAADL